MYLYLSRIGRSPVSQRPHLRNAQNSVGVSLWDVTPSAANPFFCCQAPSTVENPSTTFKPNHIKNLETCQMSFAPLGRIEIVRKQKGPVSALGLSPLTPSPFTTMEHPHPNIVPAITRAGRSGTERTDPDLSPDLVSSQPPPLQNLRIKSMEGECPPPPCHKHGCPVLASLGRVC